MKLVDAFMFAEPHEADLLWVKLNVESPVVDQWVVVENNHTLQGHFKGYHLKDLLRTDSRFARFLPKVHVIECEIRPRPSTDENKTLDTDALDVEWRQRDMAVPYLLDHYLDGDYVLISDVDECLDGESASRRRLLRRRLAGDDEVILLPRIRYWFDFDNRGLGRRCVPLVSLAGIRRDPRLGFHREQTIWRPIVWKREMVFEYSFCFPREKIMRKFDTFGHTGFVPSEVEAALRFNHRPTSARRTRILGWTYEEWFVKRRLNRRNSPAFVREHLAELRTNAVDPAYPQNRRRDYPQFFPAQPWRRAFRWALLYRRMYVDLLEGNVLQGTSVRSYLRQSAARARRVVVGRS